MGRFGYHVIDADGHGGESAELARARSGAVSAASGRSAASASRSTSPTSPGVGVKARTQGRQARQPRRPGMTDPSERLEGHGPRRHRRDDHVPRRRRRGVGAARSRLRHRAVPHAERRRAEFTPPHARSRLKSVAKLPMIDPPAAAAELRRAVTELGMVGMVTPQHVRDKNLERPELRRRVGRGRAARRRRLRARRRPGDRSGTRSASIASRRASRRTPSRIRSGKCWRVMSFTVGGILHRFPKLRVAFLEAERAAGCRSGSSASTSTGS